jgi:hypothetical protein
LSPCICTQISQRVPKSSVDVTFRSMVVQDVYSKPIFPTLSSSFSAFPAGSSQEPTGFAFTQAIGLLRGLSFGISLKFFGRWIFSRYFFGSRRLCFGNRIIFCWRLCQSQTNWSAHPKGSVVMPMDLVDVLRIGQRRFGKRPVSGRLVTFNGHLPNGFLRRLTTAAFQCISSKH